MRFHVLTAVTIIITAFWDLSPCSLADRYQRLQFLEILTPTHQTTTYYILQQHLTWTMPVHVCSSHTLWKRQTTKQASTVVLDTQQQPKELYPYVRGQGVRSQLNCRLSVCKWSPQSLHPFLPHSHILSMANNLCSWYITVKQSLQWLGRGLDSQAISVWFLTEAENAPTPHPQALGPSQLPIA